MHAPQLPPPLLELLAPLLELLPLLDPDPEPEELLPPELELVVPLLLLVVPPLLEPEPEPEPLLDVASSPPSELCPTEFAAPLHAQATTTSDADKRRRFPTAVIPP